MTLKRLHVPHEQHDLFDAQKKRDEFIRGGGLVHTDTIAMETPKKDEWVKMHLRIKESALKSIDSILANKMTGTRTSWILEAVEEKLKRESSSP